jgi:photoactive yellow protein
LFRAEVFFPPRTGRFTRRVHHIVVALRFFVRRRGAERSEAAMTEVLTITARTAPAPMEATRVPSLSDAELDALPFGVIALDPQGKVLTYNLAESRLARLDRAQVLGKNFFRRVAPCTATPEFEGRVRAFFSSAQPLDRFPYLFDFKFGAQQVEVELVRSPANDRVFLLINRKTFAGPRAGLPEGFAAPLQGELAPSEGDLGVLRDDAARRMLFLDTSFVTALHQTWLKVAPKAWPGFNREWGWQWGRHCVVDLEAGLLEERNTTLRELPMREAMELVSKWAGERGLGTLRFDFTPARHGVFGMTLERSAMGEAVGHADGSRCQLVEGLLEAICEHLAHRLLVAREMRCCAMGFGACTFVVASAQRKAAVEGAIASGAETLEAVVEALRASA